MKTTLNLPDDLLQEAKFVAVRRRTTLKAMVEHALRREIYSPESPDSSPFFSLNEYGFPELKKSGNTPVSSQMVYSLLEEG